MSDESNLQQQEHPHDKEEGGIAVDEEMVEEKQDANHGKPRRARKESKTDGEKARDAAKAVKKQERVVEKLRVEKEDLSKRVKANRDALRIAEEELEAVKAQARRTARVVTKQRAEKQQENLKVKIGRVASSKSVANQSVNCSKELLETIERSLKVAKNKAKAARDSMLRVQAKVEDAKMRCTELKIRGEEVPGESEHYKDLSAPGAWKPPGMVAAKARDKAIAELAKATKAYEKAESTVTAAEKRRQAVENRLEQAKRKRKAFDEKRRELASALEEVAPLAKAKSGHKRPIMKAKTKSNTIAMKTMKKPAKITAKAKGNASR